MQEQSFEERLILEQRKRLSLSGVESVDGFSDNLLKLSVNKTRVEIKGSGIKITAFNKASGTLNADGDFTEIRFGQNKTPLLKRIFK